jgi:hypothetical protein
LIGNAPAAPVTIVFTARQSSKGLNRIWYLMQHPFASLSPAAARRQMVSAAALALLLASSPAAAALPNADDDR